ncbi:MAG: tol-pal system protein YbgF [Minwuia thermotolerans]|nr:MAG: tol-pal system protein YbgF [Minwuia thermotolerans]
MVMVSGRGGLMSLVLVLGLAAPLATPAVAQDLAPLNDRVQRLERSVTDLKAHLLGGRPLPASPTTESGGSGPATVAERADAAGLTLKLNALEEEMRNLTNRVEEVDFKLRRIDSRMTKLVEDVDFRLTAIEKNMAAAPAPAATTNSTDGGSAPPVAGAAQGAQVLGQVTPEEVARLPQGNAPAGTGVQVEAAAPSVNQQTNQLAAAPAASTPPASGNPIDQALPEGEPRDQYIHAFGLLQAKRFAESEQAFKAFLELHPEHELAGNAQYWLGESHYVRQDYEAAASAFLTGYQKYRTSTKAPDNLLKLGITLVVLDQKQDACAVFNELSDRYPTASSSIKRRMQREKQKAGCA